MSVTIKENQAIEAKVDEQMFTGRLPALCTELDEEELAAYVALIQRKNKLTFNSSTRRVICEPCLGLPKWEVNLRHVPGSKMEKVLWQLEEATCMEANVMFTMRNDGTWRVEHNAPEFIRRNFDAWLLAGAKEQFGMYIQRHWSKLTNADKLVELIHQSTTLDELQDNLVHKFTFFWSDNWNKTTLAHFPIPTWSSLWGMSNSCTQQIYASRGISVGSVTFGDRVIQEGVKVLHYIHFPDGVVDVDAFDSSTCLITLSYEHPVYFEDGLGNRGKYKGQRQFDCKNVLYFYK